MSVIFFGEHIHLFFGTFSTVCMFTSRPYTFAVDCDVCVRHASPCLCVCACLLDIVATKLNQSASISFVHNKRKSHHVRTCFFRCDTDESELKSNKRIKNISMCLSFWCLQYNSCRHTQSHSNRFQVMFD